MLFTRSRLFASPKLPTEIENNDGNLYLIRANDKTGRSAYYFMLIDKQKRQALKEAMLKRLPFDLKQFGEVVSSGYGETVPDSLRIRIRVEYGWAS